MGAGIGWKDASVGLREAERDWRELFISHSAGNHGDEDQDKLHATGEICHSVFRARTPRIEFWVATFFILKTWGRCSRFERV